MSWLAVDAVASFDAQKPRLVSLSGVKILILKDSTGAFYAVENQCSHADVPLHKGNWDAVTALLTCPAHGAVFALRNAARPVVGPACVPLKTIAVQVMPRPGNQISGAKDLVAAEAPWVFVELDEEE